MKRIKQKKEICHLALVVAVDEYFCALFMSAIIPWIATINNLINIWLFTIKTEEKEEKDGR